MRFFNFCFLLILCGCASIPSVEKTGSSYTDDQVNQFCMIRSLAQNQNNTHLQSERITIDILQEYKISEQRFGTIIRSQIMDSTIQMIPNELAMLQQLKNKNKEVSEENAKKENELIIFNGMSPQLYYTMLKDYDRSTSFQNRVYKTCQNT